MAYDQYSGHPQQQQPQYDQHMPRRKPPPRQQAPPQQGHYDPYGGYEHEQGYEGYGYDNYGQTGGYEQGYQDQYHDGGYGGHDNQMNGASRGPPPPGVRGGRGARPPPGHRPPPGQTRPPPPPQQNHGGGRAPPGDHQGPRGGYGRAYPPQGLPNRSNSVPDGRGHGQPPSGYQDEHGYGHGYDQSYGQGYDQRHEQQYDQNYDQGYQQPPRPSQEQSRGQRPLPQRGPGQRAHQHAPPEASNFDNPFPIFPSQPAESNMQGVERRMAGMHMSDTGRPSGDRDRSNSQHSHNSKRSQRTANEQPYGGPERSYSQGAPYQQSHQGRQPDPQGARSNRPDYSRLQQHSDGFDYPNKPPPAPAHQTGFDPHIQRSMTVPADAPGRYPAQPGPMAGQHGRPPPDPVPARPSTTAGTRAANGYARHQAPNQPVYSPPQFPQQHENHGNYGDQYDAYGQPPYQNDARGHQPASRREREIEAEMPNFDAQPQPGLIRAKTDNLDHHLTSPISPTGPYHAQSYRGAPPSANAPYSSQGAYSKAKSQPDLRLQASGQSGSPTDHYGGAIPPMPNFSGGAPGRPHLPNGPQQGAYRGTPGPGMDRRTPGPPGPGAGHQQPHAQGYPPNGPQPYGQGRPGQPIQRGYTMESNFSDPGPDGQGNWAAQGIPRGPAPAHTQRVGTPASETSNPDALPQHPTPVRPEKPPPVRQYNHPTQVAGANNAPPGADPQRSQSVGNQELPVTHEEIARLRDAVRNKTDHPTSLLLAKKLVEASHVLADETGRADPKTRNKNREKYILEAHKIVKKLAQQNYPEATFYLADCYGTGGLGLPADPKEAFTLYQSAAKAGHALSAYRTAVCCEMGSEEGGGTRRDPLKAVQWYKRAAALGDVPAMYKVGMITLKGLLGQPRSPSDALTWLKRAAERADAANPHALHELALLYESASGNDRVVRDEAYAAQLLRQAAELGYKPSQFRLAQAYEHGQLGHAVEPRASIAWYTRAAAQGEHQSELALSGWYLTGAPGILDQSDTEAYLWARKAAAADPPLAKALFAMGYYTEVGIGCTRSLEQAKQWYGRAAAYKYPKAQERLDALKKGGSKAQKGRERLSRSDPKKTESECTVM